MKHQDPTMNKSCSRTQVSNDHFSALLLNMGKQCLPGI